MSLNYKEKKLENSLIEKFSIKIKIFLLGRDSTPAAPKVEPSFCFAERNSLGSGISIPSRSAPSPMSPPTNKVSGSNSWISIRLPDLPAANLSARGVGLEPAFARLPPLFVPSLAMILASFYS